MLLGALAASGFILCTVYALMKMNASVRALDEALRFITLVKGNIRLKAMLFDDILSSAQSEEYKYISFCESGASISDAAGAKAKREFSGFVSKIGTTDINGQLSICDEYYERVKELYSASVQRQKEKSRVYGALGAFGALSVLILVI